MLPSCTRILIAGAGPTGLACAVSLVVNGVEPQDIAIVDAKLQGLNSSRAVVVHSKTLEELHTIGCAEKLVAEGIRTDHLSIASGNTVLIRANFPALANRTRFPFALLISQTETERILEERLSELGVVVQRPQRLADFQGIDGGIQVTFEGGESIKTQYLVGADGSRSMVRRLCGIPYKDPFTGLDPQCNAARERSENNRPLAIADVYLSGNFSPSLTETAHLGSRGLFLFLRLPSPPQQSEHRQLYRFICMVEPGTGKIVPKDMLQDCVRCAFSLPEDQLPQVDEIIFSSTFHIRYGLADQFYHRIGGGAVALVGDAAHIHSPAGGQGMNLGIREAIHLGRLLTNILSNSSEGGSSDSACQDYALEVLRCYSEERRPLALKVISMTRTLTWVVTMENPIARICRNVVVWTLGRFSWARNAMALRFSGL